MKELETLPDDELDEVSGGMGRRPGNGQFETTAPDPGPFGTGGDSWGPTET